MRNPARNGSEARAPRQRSAVTNGRRLFVQGDGNSAWSRRYRDLIVGHLSDLGGRAAMTEAKISLIKRASAIELELEQAEGRLSMGVEIDLDQYVRAAGHLRRLLETLGIERVARPVTLDVGAIADDIIRNPGRTSGPRNRQRGSRHELRTTLVDKESRTRVCATTARDAPRLCWV